MSDYWVDSPDNPFNRMDYTRGGGGYDNSATEHSNRLRAFAMQGSGAGALPRFVNGAEAQKAADRGALPQFESIAAAQVFARRYGVSGVVQAGGKTISVGSPVTGPAKPVVSAPPSVPANTPKNANPVARPNPVVNPGGSGPGTANPRTNVAAAPSRAGSVGGAGPGNSLVANDPEQREIFIGPGRVLYPDERYVDVEDFWEPRYGEPGEYVGGGLNMIVDAEKNLPAEFGRSVRIVPGGPVDRVVQEWNRISAYADSIIQNQQARRDYGTASPVLPTLLSERTRSDGVKVYTGGRF